MWFQLFYLNSRSNFVFKLFKSNVNETTITLIIPFFTIFYHYLFYFILLQKMYSRNAYVRTSFEAPSLFKYQHAFLMTTPSPTYVNTLWMAPCIIGPPE